MSETKQSLEGKYLRFFSGQHQIGIEPKTHIVQRLPDHSVTSIPPQPLLLVVKDCGQCIEVQRGFLNEEDVFTPVGNLKKVIKSHLDVVRLATAQHADPTICIAEMYVTHDYIYPFHPEDAFKEFFYNHYFNRSIHLQNELLSIEQSLKALQ